MLHVFSVIRGLPREVSKKVKKLWRMVNSPVKALREESTDDELVPGLCEKVVDVFVDHTSQCPGAEGILEEVGPVFGEKYGCLLTPLVVCSKGLMSQGTPRVPRLLGQL